MMMILHTAIAPLTATAAAPTPTAALTAAAAAAGSHACWPRRWVLLSGPVLACLATLS